MAHVTILLYFLFTRVYSCSVFKNAVEQIRIFGKTRN